MLVLSAAKASLELSRIWYWWWHAGGMLASKRVRVATRAWWRAGWQWWCPLCQRAVQRQREQAEAAGEGHAISQLQAYCRGCRPQRRRRRRQKQPRSLESSKARSPTTTTQQNQTSSQISTIVYIHTGRVYNRIQFLLSSVLQKRSRLCLLLFTRKKICTKYLQFQTQKNRAFLCVESGVVAATTSDLQRQKTQPLFFTTTIASLLEAWNACSRKVSDIRCQG